MMVVLNFAGCGLCWILRDGVVIDIAGWGL